MIHERHAERGIGVEHLLRGDDLNLVGIDIEAEFAKRDLLNGAINPIKRLEIPFRLGEGGRARHHAASLFRNSSRKTGKISEGRAIRLVSKFGHNAETVR